MANMDEPTSQVDQHTAALLHAIANAIQSGEGYGLDLHLQETTAHHRLQDRGKEMVACRVECLIPATVIRSEVKP